MSFSSGVKAELCRIGLDRLCCAKAEAYGALLYCNTFSAHEVRIITESPDFAARLPLLIDRAFGLAFDRLPSPEEQKYIFQMTDTGKIGRVRFCTSTSVCWKKTAAAPLFCGGPFLPAAVSRNRPSGTIWSWRPATPRPAGSCWHC